MARLGPSAIQKAGRGASIDPAHPWARGIVGLWPCLECAGGVVHDLARNFDLACTGYGASNPWSAGPFGAGISGAVASAGAVGTIPPPSRPAAYPLSIACSFRLAASPSGTQRFLGVFPSSSNVSPFVVAEFYAASPTTLGVAWLSNSTPGTSNAGSIAVGQDYTAVLTVTNSGWDCWMNGLHVAGQSIAITNPAGVGPTAQVALANWPGVAGATNAVLYWGAWWSRALTSTEAAAVSSGPNAIFAAVDPGPLRWWSAVQAAGGGPWPWFFDSSHSGGLWDGGL